MGHRQILAALALALAPLAPGATAQVAVRGGVIHTMAGPPIEDDTSPRPRRPPAIVNTRSEVNITRWPAPALVHSASAAASWARVEACSAAASS